MYLGEISPQFEQEALAALELYKACLDDEGGSDEKDEAFRVAAIEVVRKVAGLYDLAAWDSWLEEEVRDED